MDGYTVIKSGTSWLMAQDNETFVNLNHVVRFGIEHEKVDVDLYAHKYSNTLFAYMDNEEKIPIHSYLTPEDYTEHFLGDFLEEVLRPCAVGDLKKAMEQERKNGPVFKIDDEPIGSKD
jgi:hypothetical protein